MIARLLCRFAWYRALRGGSWTKVANHWVRIEVQMVEPFDLETFFTDDTSLRHDYQQFLAQCDKEKQHERT